jgi:hypothetical protein
MSIFLTIGQLLIFVIIGFIVGMITSIFLERKIKNLRWFK